MQRSRRSHARHALLAGVWLVWLVGCGKPLRERWRSEPGPPVESAPVTAPGTPASPLAPAQPAALPSAEAPAAKPSAEAAAAEGTAPTAAGEPWLDGVEVVSVPYGDGETEVGFEEADESEPVGPSSFAVTDEGVVHILDAIHSRIQLYRNGAHVGRIPLPSPTIEDFALLADTRVVVLDQAGKGTVRVLDRAGAVQQELPVVGANLADAGGVTGMSARPDGVWLLDGPRMVRVVDADGRPDTARPAVVGAPARDGKRLMSAKSAGAAGVSVTLDVRDGPPSPKTTTVAFDEPIYSVEGLEDDAAGNLYLATFHVSGEGKARRRTSHLTVLSPKLELMHRTPIPAHTSVFNVFRRLDVTASGRVYYMDLGDERVVVRRYR